MNVTIPNYIFILIIGVITAAITIISSGDLIDLRFSSIIKKFKKRGKITFVLLVALIIILIIQELNIKSIENNETRTRDLLIKRAVDSTSMDFFSKISLAFAEQNLKIDTINKNFTVYKKDNINLISETNTETPVLFLYNDGIKLRDRNDTTLFFNIEFKNWEGSSANHKINTQMVIVYENDSTAFREYDFFPNIVIPKGTIWESEFEIIQKDIKAKAIFLHIYGNYSTIDNFKKIQINTIYKYDFSKKFISTPSQGIQKEVIRIIKAYKK